MMGWLQIFKCRIVLGHGSTNASCSRYILTAVSTLRRCLAKRIRGIVLGVRLVWWLCCARLLCCSVTSCSIVKVQKEPIRGSHKNTNSAFWVPTSQVMHKDELDLLYATLCIDMLFSALATAGYIPQFPAMPLCIHVPQREYGLAWTQLSMQKHRSREDEPWTCVPFQCTV